MRKIVYGLILALATVGCAARSTTPQRAARDGDLSWSEAERVAAMSQYVERLPVGGRVRVQTVDGVRWSATLLSADPQRVVLQPRGRLTEPARAIPIASLQLIEPEGHSGNNQLLKAVAVGVATGAATFVTMLLIAFATLD
jgi:hypothetical protein